MDITILKESILEGGSSTGHMDQVGPGMAIPSDGLTKEHGTLIRDGAMAGGARKQAAEGIKEARRQ